jgi:drug/metabolite transporter (DMT)-like permease
MSIGIFAALIVAAVLHAGWNALVRRDEDRSAAAIAVAAGGVVVGAVLVPFLPAITGTAALYVIGSSFIHVLYYALIARAYRHGDLSVAYPIMRGFAPLIVSIVAAIFIERPGAIVFAGVAVVAAGIVSLGLDGLRRGQRGLAAALGNAFVIATYTLVDGLGARASGAPESYVAWILIGGGLATVAFQFSMQGRAAVHKLALRWRLALASGVMGYGAYGIALWAMTVAPIGAVAAVRESSVLFATALGAVMLHEKFGATRWIAAVLVVVGLTLVKSGGAA